MSAAREGNFKEMDALVARTLIVKFSPMFYVKKLFIAAYQRPASISDLHRLLCSLTARGQNIYCNGGVILSRHSSYYSK